MMRTGNPKPSFVRCYFAVVFLFVIRVNGALAAPTIPDDFPRFIVPGHQEAMDSLRELYYLHYPAAGPKATLWDAWLSGPSLWPAVKSDGSMDAFREAWRKTLSERMLDAEGYVATHQHASIAHQDGWPFPAWPQGGPSAWGWHFVVPGPIYAGDGITARAPDGWELQGAADRGLDATAWNVELTSPGAAILSPPLSFDADNAPYIQIRWRATGLNNSQPRMTWMVGGESSFSPDRVMYFDPVPNSDNLTFTMIPTFKSPRWKGKIVRLGFHFDNPGPAKVAIQAVFTQYDTRHNTNQQNFISGCGSYFFWTRDLNFLRANIERMRLAQAYAMENLGGMENKCIVTTWPGHDGRSGIEYDLEGKKIVHPGRGIGNNYWDLLPFGHIDVYATIRYWGMLNCMVQIEKDIAAHPEWNMPAGPLRYDAKKLKHHAQEVKFHIIEKFWNGKRLVGAIDSEGRGHDYGFTFLNCEALATDAVTPEQAEAILQWLDGKVDFPNDTSKGDDIYHWRFGPRATTRRNIEWYSWVWTHPETIPWGGQVQDGGAVLGFSYFDLMGRIRFRGGDDAWKRLQPIITWFDEVEAAGGYREYYMDPARGTLQGGGTAGGLGLDQEFFESVLVPQIMISGFLGFAPRADGFSLSPRLPADWPELTVTRIALHRHILSIKAGHGFMQIEGDGPDEEMRIYPPMGQWRMQYRDSNGKVESETSFEISKYDESLPIQIHDGIGLRFERLNP